jgi:murein lipoprotein
VAVSRQNIHPKENAMNGTSDVKSRLLALAAASVLIGGLSGCATTSELNSLKDQVSAAQATADSAQAEAAAARQEAADARALAEQAMDTANEAKASADESEAKIDRMFKKAMYK